MATAATSKRILNINTVDAPKLDLIIATNDVDSYIASVARAVVKDQLKEPYISKSRSLGLTGIISKGVVQTMRYAHPHKLGYGGRPEDFYTIDEDGNRIPDPENTFEGYGNGVLVAPWTVSFDEKSYAHAAALGLYADVCANVEHGTWEELEFYIDYYHPRVVFFGSEIATYMTADKYKEIAGDFVSRVRQKDKNIICVLIPGLIYRENRKSIDLKNMVATMDKDGVNEYYQLKDRVEKESLFLSSDMNQNAEVVKIYHERLDYDDLAADKRLYGDDVGIYIGEWNLQDKRKDPKTGEYPPDYINNTLLGMSSISRKVEFAIKNNIKYLAWMSHGNLISNDDVMSNNGLAISLVTKMTNGRRKVTQFECDGLPEGVTLTTVKDGKKYYVLINNISNEVTAIDEVYVDGKLVKVPFNQSGYYGSSWGGRIDTLSGSGYDIPIPDHSMQVAEFDLS